MHARPPIAAVFVASLALSLAAVAGAARADAVPPPPADCPAGAIGITGHNGPSCTPMACSEDKDCVDAMGFDKRPRTCQELALCVEERHEKSQSGWSHGTDLTLRVARLGLRRRRRLRGRHLRARQALRRRRDHARARDDAAARDYAAARDDTARDHAAARHHAARDHVGADAHDGQAVGVWRLRGR
ncbi:MAG: hypothetical protein U1F43_15755 [Myxococcota bacterium]